MDSDRSFSSLPWRSEPWWPAALFPAGTCLLAGAFMPLAQLLAVVLARLFGPSVLLILPMTLFGALLAKGVVLADKAVPERAVGLAAAGFALGAFLASFLEGPILPPRFPATLVVGAGGGLGLSLGLAPTIGTQFRLATVAALLFPLGMVTAGPACSLGGT